VANFFLFLAFANYSLFIFFLGYVYGALEAVSSQSHSVTTPSPEEEGFLGDVRQP
jgi:hypothetical protein